MCGIAGFVTPKRAASAALVRSMCDQIVHRGPDGEGIYAKGSCGMGMRRLAIIDLNTGDQPIPNEDNSIWVVFNGEIYNFQSLREDLESRGHRFRTHSDTETLVHLYEEYGPAGVSRLRGMFAYAIWDIPRQRLFIARDRFGKKPLYYASLPEGLYFSSELKSLRAAGVPQDLDEDALRLYFKLSYIPDPLSPFRQIRKLMPGCWLTYSADGSLNEERYWSLPSPADGDLSMTEDQLYEAIREKFDESVRLRLISDVPLGAFLSGGIDSSTVVASMARQTSGPVRTFSIGFEESAYSELPYAAAVAEKYRTDHHTLIVRPDSVSLVPKLVEHFGEPFADSSAIPTYLVSDFAAQHVKVVLTGDGGDEIFAGYESFRLVDGQRKWDQVPLFARNLLQWTAKRLPYAAYGKNYLWMVSRSTPLERYFEWNHTQHFLLDSLLQPEWRADFDAFSIRDRFSNCLLPEGADIVNQALYFEATAKLAGDMLVKVDRMSMARSLEVRCPMLDHELAELAARIPYRWKIRNGQGKYCFLESMKERLPESVWNRPKRGFSVPIREWLCGPLREMLHDYLLTEQFAARGFVSKPFLKQLIEEHWAGRRDNRQILWALLILEIWHRQWKDVAPALEPVGAER